MDETIPPLIQEPEPTVTLPISLFLEILWGHKKHAELRERAVPDPATIPYLKAIPNYEKYFHIQEAKDGALASVWQLAYWRSSGIRETERNEKLETYRELADAVTEAIVAKLSPPFPVPAARQLALDLIDKKQWITLESMGVDCTKLKNRETPPPPTSS